MAISQYASRISSPTGKPLEGDGVRPGRVAAHPPGLAGRQGPGAKAALAWAAQTAVLTVKGATSAFCRSPGAPRKHPVRSARNGFARCRLRSGPETVVFNAGLFITLRGHSMKFSARVLAFATVATVAVLSPLSSNAQARPAASEIIAKYVTAIGGESEIRKITSMKQVGTLNVPAIGLSATMEAYMAAPNKMATKTSIPGMGEMLQGTNGTVAWDVNPMAGRACSPTRNSRRVRERRLYASLLYGRSLRLDGDGQ
jgi:hypothetical protein